jgi:hypothetical protein
MSVMSSSSETPVLQDYVQPVVASLNSGKTNERKRYNPYCWLSCFVMFGITILDFLTWKFGHKTKMLYYLIRKY